MSSQANQSPLGPISVVATPNGESHGQGTDPWPEAEAIGTVHLMPSGTALFRQGDEVQMLHLISSGCVKLTCSDELGRLTLLALRWPGWLLGMAAAILARPHPVTAETVGTCHLRSIAAAAFLCLRRSNVEVMLWIQRLQAHEAYEQASLSGLMGAADCVTRLERLIVKLLDAGHEVRKDGSLRLTTHLRQEEIAQAIGTTRETVSRVLHRLEARGEIRRDKGWLVIPPNSRLITNHRSLRIVKWY